MALNVVDDMTCEKIEEEEEREEEQEDNKEN